jgi:drug/metabolite transporter (DMT)-like permease
VPQARPNPSYLKGVAFGIAVAVIAAGWSAFTRLAVTTGLDAWDIAALRFGVAGLVLTPVVARRGLALDRLGWLGLAVIVAGGGAPYALAAAEGLRFAPASDQGALNPGCTPLFVALIAATVLRERLSRAQQFGLAMILVGALIIVGWRSAGWSLWRGGGDALFLVAAFLWACFTVAMRRAQLDPLHAAAIVSTGSLAIYLPLYAAVHGPGVAQVPLAELTAQAVFQGVVVTIISLLCYGWSVAILGASAGAVFLALVPALSALLAIPVLGEWPTPADWVAIALISAGVYMASGRPLPESR